jgi:hypothetical protein
MTTDSKMVNDTRTIGRKNVSQAHYITSALPNFPGKMFNPLFRESTYVDHVTMSFSPTHLTICQENYFYSDVHEFRSKVSLARKSKNPRGIYEIVI